MASVIVPAVENLPAASECAPSSLSRSGRSQEYAPGFQRASDAVWKVRHIVGRIDVVERNLQRTDKARTGIVKTEEFKAALNNAGLNLLTEEISGLCQAYGVEGVVHWSEFIKDLCNVDETFSDKADTERYDGGRIARPDVSEECRALLNQLAIFFRERRVLVSDAFIDFEKPGKFCKRVRRVTTSQFKEAMYFLTKGMNDFTERNMDIILSLYQEKDGLIRYRDFIRDVEPPVDSTSLCVLSAANTERSVSPQKSNSPGWSNDELPGKIPAANRLGSPSGGAISPFLLGVQPMGPADCQNPSRLEFKPIAGCRVSPGSEGRKSLESLMAKIRHFCSTFNIIMVDYMRDNDKLREGTITCSQFRRIMDVLRVFKLTEAELEAIEVEYKLEVNQFGNPDMRFNYRRFCQDLQPAGPDWVDKNAQLRKDDASISPFSVNQVSQPELEHINFVLQRLAIAILKRRISFRQYFEDFDRTTKTRTGSTRHNYTLNAGCISRSQLFQALKSMGLSQLLDDNDSTLLFKRYERNGEINYLVFLRDLEEVEKKLADAVQSPHS